MSAILSFLYSYVFVWPEVTCRSKDLLLDFNFEGIIWFVVLCWFNNVMSMGFFKALLEKLDVHEIGSYHLLNSTKKHSHYIQFILNPPQTKSFSYLISLLICAMYVVCVFFVITLFFLIVIFAYSFYYICVESQIILSQILANQK